MKRARKLLAAAMLGATLLAGSHARADDRAVDEAAKARYTEGVKLYNRKKYEEARAAFLQAIALKKRPAAVMMLAESALKSGRWLEAARSFDEFTSLSGDMPPKLKTLVEDGKREARAHLGRLTFDVPEGAEVSVDGEKLDPVKPLEVAVGSHTIVVTHREENKTVEVVAEAGKTTEVHPSFVPKAIIPTDTRTRPASTVPKPASAAEPESPGLLSPPATKWPVYVLGAVGVGGLATAALFGGLAANARHSVEVHRATLQRNAKPGADCSRPATFVDEAKGQTIEEFNFTCANLIRQQGHVDANEGIFLGSLVVGLAGIAGAVTWFLVAPKEGALSDDKPKEQSTETLVIPWAGLQGGGVLLERRF